MVMTAPAQDAEKEGEKHAGPLDFSVETIDGQKSDLSQYKGKVVLVVNVASKCGLTPQYEQLEALNRKYGEKGLVILGFPANNFGGQEPGTNESIKKFCTSKYGVTFPMFAKVSVKGEDCCPLYKYLTSSAENAEYGGEIKWNFTKFLIGRDGKVAGRFEPRTRPDAEEVIRAIESALSAKP